MLKVLVLSLPSDNICFHRVPVIFPFVFQAQAFHFQAMLNTGLDLNQGKHDLYYLNDNMVMMKKPKSDPTLRGRKKRKGPASHLMRFRQKLRSGPPAPKPTPLQIIQHL